MPPASARTQARRGPREGEKEDTVTTKHTPGEWGCATNGNAWLVVSLPVKEGEWIAEINREMPEEEAAANGHLLAAAPALLELILEIARNDSDVRALEAWADPATGKGEDWLRRANRAIAQATGKK